MTILTVDATGSKIVFMMKFYGPVHKDVTLSQFVT